MTGIGSSCGACKFLRRRCAIDCIFAPYFGHEQASTHFAAVHKVFGASNVSKLLLHLPVDSRSDAALTISYEALARMRDPVYGCVAHIFALQQQVANLQEEIEFLVSHIAANHMMGLPTNGISQAMSNDQHHSYFSPPNDVMNTIYFQNQQQAASPSSEGLVSNPSQAFDSHIDDLQVSSSLQGWQDQNFGVVESSLNHMLGFLEGEDQDNLSYYPWLDIYGNVNVNDVATV